MIRFAGDSGDGMQLTGDRFTSETAVFGNDLSTFPDFPAEIRAPAGSLPGVSGFQVHFADHDILTPGDPPNVLVAMNPAALKTNVDDLVEGRHADRQLRRLQRPQPREGRLRVEPARGRLARRATTLHAVPLSSMTLEALKDIEGVTTREAERSKNMFALGLMSWLYHRPTEGTVAFIAAKFASKPGDRRGEHEGVPGRVRRTARRPRPSPSRTRSTPAKLKPGTYRNITGNQALSLGLVAASKLSGLPLFLGAYPITPASAILEQLAGYKHFGVRTFQAEDEIAAAGAALGASFGGALGVTTSAGPGIVLKSETIGLAVTLELPLVILDVQRAGPSTGMPTKPEQGDLLMVLFGRNGESPVPVVAASTPGAVLRRGDRGGADRAQVPHAGVPALGRVPRERLRAVAHPRRRRRCPTSRPSSRPGRTPTASSCRTCATPRRSRARGRCRARRARAPDRRPREGRRHRQHLLRPREPRPDDAAAGAEGRRDRSRHPRARGRPPGRRDHARARLGRHLRPDRRGGAQGARGRRQGRPRPPPPPQPVPAQHRRGAALLRPGARSPR